MPAFKLVRETFLRFVVLGQDTLHDGGNKKLDCRRGTDGGKMWQSSKTDFIRTSGGAEYGTKNVKNLPSFKT